MSHSQHLHRPSAEHVEEPLHVADEPAATEREPAARSGPAVIPGLVFQVRRTSEHGRRDALGGTEVDSRLTATLRRRAGGGQELGASVASSMGEALGTDLSGVRVHADAEADQVSRAMHATAFTYGRDVYFTQGAYSPGTQSGERLLAHELAHVAQGQSSPATTGSTPTIGRADDPAEAAADAIAASALRRRADPTGGQAASVAVGAEPESGESVRRSPAGQTAVVRRGLFDDFKSKVGIYPRVTKLGKSGKEQVRLKKDGDEAEARQIIDELANTYGIEVSAATTIEGIKNQYSRVLASELKKLQGGVWEMKELRALRSATARFGAILGPLRAGSTVADKAQGVTSVGRLKQAIDANSSKGKVDKTTMGEFFGGKSNVGLFNTVTDLVDGRYVREGKTKGDNDTTLEANAIHEMAHGLIQPLELGNWIAAMDFWTDQYTPSGKSGAELPPTGYGRTGGAAEDLSESVAIFFINRPQLKSVAPQREAFLAKMVAKWQPAKTEEVIDTAEKTTSSESVPTSDGGSILASVPIIPTPMPSPDSTPTAETPSVKPEPVSVGATDGQAGS